MPLTEAVEKEPPLNAAHGEVYLQAGENAKVRGIRKLRSRFVSRRLVGNHPVRSQLELCKIAILCFEGAHLREDRCKDLDVFR